MTTPVFMEEAKKNAEGRMGFVIPKNVATRGAPSPIGASILRRNEFLLRIVDR